MSTAPRLDRSSPPEPRAVRRFGFPEVRSASLANGLDVRVARLPRLPVATLQVVVDAGEAAVLSEDAGLALLTAEGLEGGTSARSGPELADALERLGASLEVSAGWDAASVGLTCLVERLAEAAPLLAEVLLRPAFPEDEVARCRDRQLATLEHRKKDPRALANDMAAAFYYAAGVPYARPLSGRRESVERLTREHANTFYRARYRPGGSGVVLVGDVEPERALALVAEQLGPWTGEPAAPPEFEAVSAVERRTVFVVHRPGAVQSEIRIGHVGADRGTPDYFPLIVLNTLLGGAFTSRLNLNLRERHGYTYGARSRFSFRRRPGPFIVDVAVATEVTADAVRETMTEIDGLLREGPGADEVAAAKDYIAGVFPLQLETTAQVAGRITELIIYELPDPYYQVYRDRVLAVTPGEAHEAGLRHIHPDHMAVVVVGDADAIRPPLEALEIGAVEVHAPS